MFGHHHLLPKKNKGNPLYATESTLHHVSAQTLKNYLAKHLSASQLTIVGAGVNHDDLVRIASATLEKLPSAGSFFFFINWNFFIVDCSSI